MEFMSFREFMEKRKRIAQDLWDAILRGDHDRFLKQIRKDAELVAEYCSDIIVQILLLASTDVLEKLAADAAGQETAGERG